MHFVLGQQIDIGKTRDTPTDTALTSENWMSYAEICLQWQA